MLIERESPGHEVPLGEPHPNQFAASLLMPADWVHDEVEQRMGMPTGRLISELASQFFVSEQAMEYRLMNLGLRAAP